MDSNNSLPSFHPLSLRPGGPSPSTSPRPEQQQQQQRANMASSSSPAAHFATTGGSPPQLQETLPSAQRGARFPSSAYPAGMNFQSKDAPALPPSNGIPNSFAESSTTGQQRTRSGTFGHNHHGVADGGNQPPMPTSGTTPLFAQHSGQPSASSTASRPVSRSQPLSPPMSHQSRPNTSAGPVKSPFTTPITSPPRSRPSQILLINPTSTSTLTTTMLSVLRPILPPQLEVVGYTAPYPAPTATETNVDAALSTELILRDLAQYAATNGETVQNFDAILIASYSKHPLIEALRESYDVPIIGIMEGSLYVSRMLGARFGIIATTTRHRIQQDDAVRAYGLEHFYIGSESLHLSSLDLDPTRPIFNKDEIAKRVAHAAKTLVARGCDTLILGSESMSSNEIIRLAKDAIRDDDGRRTVNVVDPVEAGIMCLNALVGMGVPTSKKGVYKGEREGRRARGQNWL